MRGKYDAKVTVYNLTYYGFNMLRNVENLLRRISRKRATVNYGDTPCFYVPPVSVAYMLLGISTHCGYGTKYEGTNTELLLLNMNGRKIL